MWNGNPQTLKDRLLSIKQMGRSTSIPPHTNKDIGFFEEKYKGINKDDKLGDLYPWGPNPDRSTSFIFSAVEMTKKNFYKSVFLLLLKKKEHYTRKVFSIDHEDVK